MLLIYEAAGVAGRRCGPIDARVPTVRGRDWLVLDVESNLDAVVARGRYGLVLYTTSNLDATAVPLGETDSSLIR